jgi:hypothetical protein
MSIRFRCPCGAVFQVADDAAGKKAKCSRCGQYIRVPAPPAAAGQAAKPAAAPAPAPAPPRAARPPARPAAPPSAVPPPPAVPSPAASPPAGASAAKPARAAAKPTLLGRPARRRFVAFQVVLGICICVMLVVVVDAIVFITRCVRADLRDIALYHVIWLPFLVVAFFVAAAAAKGSRLCMGIVLGGALRGLIVNAPATIVMAAMGLLAREMMFVGIGGLILAGLYVVVPLASAPVRRYVAGHGGIVGGGAAMGFFLGGLIAATALPGVGVLFTREIPTGRLTGGTGEGPMAKLLPGPDKKDLRIDCQNNMVRIHNAIYAHVLDPDNRQYFPPSLGAIVSKECPPKTMICPALGRKPPEYDPAKREFKGKIDYVFLFGRYHLYDLPDPEEILQLDDLRRMVLCYLEPKALPGKEVLVLRPPLLRSGIEQVEWIPLDRFQEELAFTREWLGKHPPRPPMRIEE